MGYSVYYEAANARWAGYDVPAPCDWPDCDADIDRGFVHKCEDLAQTCLTDDCGLFFCDEHYFEDHSEVEPKPDSREWLEWMLTDESWAQWRAENPEEVAATKAALA